ncbi:DUF3114 domain-containing protein [Streptococcus suis]|uniref:DUF3114 domain-containing protein n=1 Tax=Streptococcus suis TaxID=1307 RepID=UPI000CF40834|nr:DUF3114 domain-containing protein [Streptococcus suis]
MLPVFLGLLILLLIVASIRYTNRRKKGMKDLEQIEPVQQAVRKLRKGGWSDKAIQKAFLSHLHRLPKEDISIFTNNFTAEAVVFASASFYQLLRAESRHLTKEKAQSLLERTMKNLAFPAELDHSHLPDLLEKIDCDCPPHHPFWWYFAGLVDRAFPEQQLAENGALNRQVHQLRYLISYQQASWVRQHYGQGKTDWQALVAYLASLPRWSYRLRESARLHNKKGFGQSRAETLPINLKVLIGFHSEFILAQDGPFALILDEKPSKNGVVNGASFNYARANNKRHAQLDMAPVGPHDPAFRKKTIRSKARTYLSPSRIFKHQVKHHQTAWEQSYFNPNGVFSFRGNSRAGLVAGLSKRFAKDIRFEMYQKLISWYNKE